MNRITRIIGFSIIIFLNIKQLYACISFREPYIYEKWTRFFMSFFLSDRDISNKHLSEKTEFYNMLVSLKEEIVVHYFSDIWFILFSFWAFLSVLLLFYKLRKNWIKKYIISMLTILFLLFIISNYIKSYRYINWPIPSSSSSMSDC